MNRILLVLAGAILAGMILAPCTVDASLTKESWPRESTAAPTPSALRGDCTTPEYHYYLFGTDPFAIPDNAPGIDFTLPTGGCGIIEDVVVGFNMTHSWIGDLYVRLGYDMDNDGTDDAESTVLCRPGVDDCSFDAPPYGCDGDLDGSYTFSTHGFGTLGETTLGTCASTFPSGCYRPDPFFADFSVFEGLPLGGTYSLFVQDNASGDTGTISWFSVYVLASENVIYVPGNVPTVQMAIDVACEGAEIVIAPGAYPEPIEHAYPSLTIRAEDPANRPVLSSFLAAGSTPTSLSLSDLEFTGGVNLGFVAPAVDASVSNCVIGGPLTCAASGNLTVDGTVVSGDLNAITIGSGDVLISNVQAQQIDVDSYDGAIVTGSQTSGDISVLAEGVDVGVADCRAAGIRMIATSGFSIQNVAGIVSMHLFGGECVFLANTIVGGQSHPPDTPGVLLTGYGSATVTRNIVDGFDLGIRLRGGAIDGLACNDVSNCDVPWDIDILPDPTGTNGNFSADPLFCDRAAGDYRLSEDSPCLPGNHPDGFPCGGTLGAVTETCAPSAVDPGEPTLGTWGLVRATPNPVRTEVTLTWNLPGDEETRLSIVSVDGRRVWSGTFPGASGSSVWDLRGANGEAVTPGAYFVRATSGNRSTATRLLLLR